jgi:hypothetical protein
MTTTFRIRKHHRNLAALSLTLFVAVGAASAFCAWTDAPKDRRIYLVVVFLSFWGAMACLSLWGLFAYLRERLEIQNGLVSHQGVIGKREIALDAVTDAHWQLGRISLGAAITDAPWKLGKNGGRLELRTPTQRLTVHFENFEPAERLSLYRFFRRTLPERPQRGWDLFCYKVALPHLDQSAGKNNHDGTPKRGMVSKPISAEPEVNEFLFFELFGLCIFGLVLFTVVKLPSPHALVLGSIACVLWFGGLLWRAQQVDRERNHRDLEHVEAATRRWNAEGGLQMSPVGDDRLMEIGGNKEVEIKGT